MKSCTNASLTASLIDKFIPYASPDPNEKIYAYMAGISQRIQISQLCRNTSSTKASEQFSRAVHNAGKIAENLRSMYKTNDVDFWKIIQQFEELRNEVQSFPKDRLPVSQKSTLISILDDYIRVTKQTYFDRLTSDSPVIFSERTVPSN